MIHELKEQRALAVTEMRGIVEKAKAEKRNLSADEAAKFDGLKAKITELEGQEARTSFLENAERSMNGVPVDGDKAFSSLESNVSLMSVIRAGMEGRALSGAEAEYSKEIERRTGRKAGGVFVPLSVLEKRVNTTTTGTQLVATEHRPDQFIEPLRNKLLMRQLGVRVLSGLEGSLSIPAYTSGVTAGWVAENGSLTPSDMDFDSKSLSPKHVGALSEMSRQLIQQSSPDIEQLLRDDMSFALAAALDSALIKGGGTNEPTGIIGTTGVQTHSLATLDWAGIASMVEKIELANATAGAWLTSPGVAKKLRVTLKSATAGAAYLCENNRMADLPVNSTKQVPLATAKGQLILGDFSQVLLGIWSELDILVNPFDSTAYARGGVLVRAMATCDIALRQPTAFVLASDITVS
ncbi:phage major capsid protein, HK97 family [Nitrosospira sp. Nsp18]|uniref:phage major capsid protein n=1 Tax=Nitrosospira sp. Nsp18 TaxID=1855334 RepID=UPI00087F455B|nr:phage major capsid protein [Nitrosospira sp. Nsp18]SDA27083.1 phage major capsid protein, HK97 family [Nitrosospira sp. Nsp18]